MQPPFPQMGLAADKILGLCSDMNRRGFLGLLGLAPFLGLARRLSGMEPKKVAVFEPTYTEPDPDWDKLCDYFMPAKGPKTDVYANLYRESPFGMSLEPGCPENDAPIEAHRKWMMETNQFTARYARYWAKIHEVTIGVSYQDAHFNDRLFVGRNGSWVSRRDIWDSTA
jgi:hypothetical protein